MFRGTCDAPGESGAVGGCAQLTGAPPPPAIGKIHTATGLVTVMDARGVVAQVKVGDPVYRHDTLETGADGAVGITFIDGTAFNLSNNARMALNTSNSALFSLSKGVFAFIAGKVAKAGGLRIDTPFARIPGPDRGIGILTLAALAFSTIREIQAAPRSDAFLDDGAITYKDSPHGTFEITTRDGRVIVADDPGETVVVDPAGSVTRIPNSSSRMAELQQAQQNALNTLSLGLGQQGAAPGGSSTPTFNAPLQLQPINFGLPQNNGPAPLPVTITTPTNQGIIDFSSQPPPPPVTKPTSDPLLAADVSGRHVIIAHTTGSGILDTTPSGVLTFTDFDASAVSTGVSSITWSGGSTPSGVAEALAGAVSSTIIGAGSDSGSIVLTFSAADNNFDFLAAGETLTIIYNVTVTDNNGFSLTQPVTVTVVGTNDPPVLAADASGPHTIIKHVPLTGSTSPDTSSGNLTFTDPNLSDTHQASASKPTFAWSGGALTAAQQAALAAASTLTLSETDSTGSGAGSLAFRYSAADKTFDFLAFGQTLTITYNVTVTDNQGASSTQSVTITVIGTDAAPVLGNVAATASFVAEPEPASSTPVTLSSALTVSDVDNQTLKSATVSITSGFFAGDVLSANVAGTSITASYDATTGVLTLTGNDTLAHYQQVLDSVTYKSTSANPTNFGTDPTRTISWVVNDGTLNSAPQATTVIIVPDFLTIPAGQTVTLNGGTLQALFIQVDGTVTGFGTIIANVITNNGTIQSKSNHTLTIEISGSIQGTGLLEITNNTTLALDGPVGSGQTVQFDIRNGPTPNLILNDPSHFQGQISGFQGTDTIDLPTIHFDSGTTATFSGGILTIKEGTTTIAALTFVGSPNLKIASDGHGGTLITDPPPSTTTPDATVTPVAQTPTLIATEAMGAQKNVTLATVDEATAVALNPISHSIAGTLADSATVDVINGKPAGAVSGPGALKIDAGATPQLDGSHAVNVTFAGSTGGTNTDAINLPENHTITTAQHVPDRGRGGTSVGDPPVSATGEDSSAQSTSVDNHVIVSSPLTETLSGNGDHSAFLFKPNVDHPAIANPDINLVSIARDHLPLQHPADMLHMPARLDDSGAPAMTDGAQPAHPHSDVNQSASFRFDDGGAHPAHATGKDASVQSTPADNGHHAIADPEISLASITPNHLPGHPADNSLHMPAQLDGNGVLTVTDGAHPADLPVDINQLPSFKFADDGSTHPGTVPYGQPTLTALSGGLSGDHGPATPALAAKTFNVPGTVMSDAASDKFIFGKGFDHDTIADHKPDMTEIDHTVPATIQHLLNTAHDTNAVSALDPNHATAPQDMTKIQLPHHQADFHFA